MKRERRGKPGSAPFVCREEKETEREGKRYLSEVIFVL
jgi:hypothetical protein